MTGNSVKNKETTVQAQTIERIQTTRRILSFLSNNDLGDIGKTNLVFSQIVQEREDQQMKVVSAILPKIANYLKQGKSGRRGLDKIFYACRHQLIAHAGAITPYYLNTLQENKEKAATHYISAAIVMPLNQIKADYLADAIRTVKNQDWYLEDLSDYMNATLKQKMVLGEILYENIPRVDKYFDIKKCLSDVDFQIGDFKRILNEVDESRYDRLGDIEKFLKYWPRPRAPLFDLLYSYLDVLILQEEEGPRPSVAANLAKLFPNQKDQLFDWVEMNIHALICRESREEERSALKALATGFPRKIKRLVEIFRSRGGRLTEKEMKQQTDACAIHQKKQAMFKFIYRFSMETRFHHVVEFQTDKKRMPAQIESEARDFHDQKEKIVEMLQPYLTFIILGQDSQHEMVSCLTIFARAFSAQREGLFQWMRAHFDAMMRGKEKESSPSSLRKLCSIFPKHEEEIASMIRVKSM
jgi:hypothetical protein